MLMKKKYVVMSRDQNAGRSHSIKFDNSSVEREWNSSNVWEHTEQITVLFRNKLRAD